MGLKLRWFRARVSFGSPKEKHNTVTGVGFKQTSEVLPTYKPLNTEFSSPILTRSYHGREQKTKREVNSEVALKVRSMLSRSYSNVQTEESNNHLHRSKSTENLSNKQHDLNTEKEENVKYNNNKNDTILEYEKRKAELLSDCSDSDENINLEQTLKVPPKSILKKVSIDESNRQKNNEITQEDTHDAVFNVQENNNKIKETDILLVPKRNVSNTNLSVISSEYSEPPSINYDTLPKSNPEELSKHWESLVSPSDDEYDDTDDIQNVNSDNYDPMDDQAYVIEIQEGVGTPEPVPNILTQQKQKKSISFEDQVTEIKTDNLYDEVTDSFNEQEDHEHRLSTSSGSIHSEENNPNDDSYGNDYANTKRTSYFQAGGTTFSSQAASIFFGNKKPVNERRPTTFVPRRVSEDSQSEA